MKTLNSTGMANVTGGDIWCYMACMLQCAYYGCSGASELCSTTCAYPVTP